MDDDIVKLTGTPLIISWIVVGVLVLFSVVCVCNKRLNRYLREHSWVEGLLEVLVWVSVWSVGEKCMPWGWALLIATVLTLVLFARFWTPRRKK